MLTPGADPVRKVSIIPRGQALGVTLSTPESDRYSYSPRRAGRQIKVALGGRAAEKVVFGDITTGAESDIQNLTQIARSMVGRWGMSDAIGAIAVTDRPRRTACCCPAQHRPRVRPSSWSTRRSVGSSTARRRRSSSCSSARRSRLETLAHALLERETLDQPEAMRTAGGRAARVRRSA
jgi:cell division protease FtsH